MLWIELAVIDAILILVAFLCYTVLSNRSPKMGAGIGTLMLGIAAITTFPFVPWVGAAVILIALWILSLRSPQT
ncbi:MAG: hypothetical protein AAF708_08065 [Deinococcota bacterium]